MVSGSYATFVRILVEDENTGPGGGIDVVFTDLDDLNVSGTTAYLGHGNRFLESVEISDDVDSPGAQMSFKAAREVYDWSISPGMGTTSPVTASHGNRLLELAKRVRAEVAIMPHGSSYEDVEAFQWITIFDGFISNIDFGDETVNVSARDLSAPLAFTFCRPLAANSYKEKIYGDDTSGVAIQTVIQAIIDDHVPAGGMIGGAPTLDVPVSPSWNLRKRTLDFAPILDNITGKSDQIGWALRYKWNDTLEEFRLTLYEPERASPTVLRTFDVDDYWQMSRASMNEDNIRNVCEVVYTNRSGTADSTGQFPRARVSASDSASIALYGERYCQIAEEAASQIDTSTEAQALADAAVSDLAYPKSIVEVTAPFLLETELQDYYAFQTDGVHFDADLEVAVTGYRHSFDAKDAFGQTELSLRGVPASGVDRHMGNLADPGTAPFAPFSPPFDGVTISAPTVTAKTNALYLSWASPINTLTRAFDWTEVHISSSSGFTPSSSTLKSIVRGTSAWIDGLTAGTTYYAKLVHRDRSKNVSAASTQSTGRTPVALDPTVSISLYLAADRTLTVGTTAGDRLRFDTLHTESQSGIANALITDDTNRTYFTAPWTGIFRNSIVTTIAYTGTNDWPVVELYKNGHTADGTGTGTSLAASLYYFQTDSPLGVAEIHEDVYLVAGDTLVVKASDGGKASGATQKGGLKLCRWTITTVGTAD